MREKLIKNTVIGIGIIVLLLMSVFHVRDLTRVANWTRSGFVMSSLRQPADSIAIFFGADSKDFKEPPYPVAGDTLLTLNDTTANERVWIKFLEVAHTPGREVKATFVHKGEIQTTAFHTRPVQPLLKVVVIALQVLKALIFLCFMAVGFWALRKQLQSEGVRVLALFCFAMASFTLAAYMPMYREMASFTIPAEAVFANIIGGFSVYFGAFWLHLNQVFPRRSRWMAAHPHGTRSVIYIPLALLQLIFYVMAIILHHRLPFLRFFFYAVVASQSLVGLFLLWRHFRAAETNLEKRQTRLVLLGSGCGLVLLIIYLLHQYGIVPILFRLPIVYHLTITNVIFLALLLSPITLAYAFGKYRLLEVEAKLRRGTRYFIAYILLIAIVAAVGYVFGGFVERVSGAGNRMAAIVVSFVLLVTFTPLLPRLRAVLIHRFFPERERLRHNMVDLLQRSAAFEDRNGFWVELENRLRDGLLVETVFPVLRGPQNGAFYLRDHEPTPFHCQSDLMRMLEDRRKPLMVDEVLCCNPVPVSEEEGRWLTDRRVALLLPMVTQGRLVGFLGFGGKTDQDDYAAEELRILDELAPQFAMAADNMRLVEENFDRQRLQEQLSMARHVQEGFLPHDLPATPGLHLAALSTFSLEVAGDYYDVIPLEGGRTVLAVGDVAGKGAAAALLMANLQASLRALCGVGLRPAELMNRINKLIFHNTEPDQFITFFVAVFDPHGRTLTYVNAGHNPPFLLSHGNLQPLSTGGTIVGAFEETTYEQASLTLASGDVLLIYTDGISEAMNEREEELGEQRLCDVLCRSAGSDVHVILDNVRSVLAAHQHVTQPEDDQTLLVAKIA
jgi:phosphoserine phosphatase RsbU/P